MLEEEIYADDDMEVDEEDEDGGGRDRHQRTSAPDAIVHGETPSG